MGVCYGLIFYKVFYRSKIKSTKNLKLAILIVKDALFSDQPGRDRGGCVQYLQKGTELF